MKTSSRSAGCSYKMPKRTRPYDSWLTEQVQKYWDRRPCNIAHSPLAIGSEEYFDEVEARKYLVEPHIPGFAQFERWAGKRVLEVGCGIGTDTMNFARYGAIVTAVDISEASLALARRRARVFGLEDRITFYRANAEELSRELPTPAEGNPPYDLIYSFGVLHHTPCPERAMAELALYARRGTVLKVMLYHRRSLKVASAWLRREHVKKHSEAQPECPVTHTYTRAEAERLIQSARPRPGTWLAATARDCAGGCFTVTDMRVEHIFPYRIPDYVHYRYVKKAWVRALPAAWFRALEQRFGWHLLITAECDRRAELKAWRQLREAAAHAG